MVAAIKVSVPVPAVGRSVAILDDTALAETMRKCVVWTCLLKGLLWKYCWRDTRDHTYLKLNVLLSHLRLKRTKEAVQAQQWSKSNPRSTPSSGWLGPYAENLLLCRTCRTTRARSLTFTCHARTGLSCFTQGFDRLRQAKISIRCLLFGVWVSFAA